MVEELLAAELAKLRIVPGNEAQKFAKTIVDLVHKFDASEEELTKEMFNDPSEELLKNDKAMMGAIVSLSKLVTSMHDTIKRHFDAVYDDGKETITGGSTTAKGEMNGNTIETVTS